MIFKKNNIPSSSSQMNIYTLIKTYKKLGGAWTISVPYVVRVSASDAEVASSLVCLALSIKRLELVLIGLVKDNVTEVGREWYLCPAWWPTQSHYHRAIDHYKLLHRNHHSDKTKCFKVTFNNLNYTLTQRPPPHPNPHKHTHIHTQTHAHTQTHTHTTCTYKRWIMYSSSET